MLSIFDSLIFSWPLARDLKLQSAFYIRVRYRPQGASENQYGLWDPFSTGGWTIQPENNYTFYTGREGLPLSFICEHDPQEINIWPKTTYESFVFLAIWFMTIKQWVLSLKREGRRDMFNCFSSWYPIFKFGNSFDFTIRKSIIYFSFLSNCTFVRFIVLKLDILWK